MPENELENDETIIFGDLSLHTDNNVKFHRWTFFGKDRQERKYLQTEAQVLADDNMSLKELDN